MMRASSVVVLARVMAFSAVLSAVGCGAKTEPGEGVPVEGRPAKPEPTAPVAAAEPQGTITTVAGTGDPRYSGDGGLATEASLMAPLGVVVGADGTLYIADQQNARIRKVGRDGIITTVAGNGTQSYSGDGGSATRAGLRFPHHIALGPDGPLYIADRDNCRIRRVDAKGVIVTVAGDGWTSLSGDSRYAGDKGPATKASLNYPEGVAVGPDGSLYVADCENYRIRKIDRRGVITTVAGNGEVGYSGDGGPALEASLDYPIGLAVGPDGSLYIADTGNNRIRRVSPKGIITTVAGNGEEGYGGDGGPATAATLSAPYDVALCADGGFYIADTVNDRVRKVDAGGTITTVAGDGWTDEFGRGRCAGDDGPAIKASLDSPAALAIAPNGDLYVADRDNHRVRKVSFEQTRAAGGERQ